VDRAVRRRDRDVQDCDVRAADGDRTARTTARGGQWALTLDGTLTVHGVSKPASWKATATRAGRDLTSSATTLIHWAAFNVEKPQARGHPRWSRCPTTSGSS
jgi:polyisoprenoid-binding protein YceI